MKMRMKMRMRMRMRMKINNFKKITIKDANIKVLIEKPKEIKS